MKFLPSVRRSCTSGVRVQHTAPLCDLDNGTPAGPVPGWLAGHTEHGMDSNAYGPPQLDFLVQSRTLPATQRVVLCTQDISQTAYVCPRVNNGLWAESREEENGWSVVLQEGLKEDPVMDPSQEASSLWDGLSPPPVTSNQQTPARPLGLSLNLFSSGSPPTPPPLE